MLNFVSCRQMNEWTLDFIKDIPNQFDLVVGIPRSGLQFASLVATKFGRPLVVGDSIWEGHTMPKGKVANSILVCDDTLSTGKTMFSFVEGIRARFPGAVIKTAVVIIQPDVVSKVDYWYEKIGHPRMFEWNIAHGKFGNLACDIDGVICQDLSGGLDEQTMSEVYEKYITNVPPVFIPQYTIDTIVSCRLEKWRQVTENWLPQHGVKYNQLLLWDVKEPRERAGQHGGYKVQRIKECGATYAFESDWDQAQIVAKSLGIPVLCFSRMVLVGGGGEYGCMTT